MANPWQLVASKLVTQYSNNIRNNFGFLNRLSPRTRYGDDKLFRQQGRKVFKEVLPLVCDQIASQLAEQGWAADGLSRLWLHQANLTMNQFIGRKLLGHDASQQEAPVILDRYGNTSSAGSIIAFHLFNRICRAGLAGCSAPLGPVTPSAACCCSGAEYPVLPIKKPPGRWLFSCCPRGFFKRVRWSAPDIAVLLSEIARSHRTI